MKRLFALLTMAAICAVVSATPVTAQVAGNPGDLHARTPYMQRHHSNLGQRYRYSPGYAGPTALVPQAQCGVITDFVANGGHQRMTAVCPLFP